MSTATSSAIVFTSAPAPRSQAVSELFKQYGITGEVATPAREVALVPISRPTILQGALLVTFISTLLQAALLNITMAVDCLTFKSVLGTPSRLKLIFTTPEIVVSFRGLELKDNIAALAASYNFRKESSGRRTYYRGAPTLEAISAFAKAGCEMDAYAPYGATNIHGYSAFNNAQKILLSVCACLGSYINDTTTLFDLAANTVSPRKLRNKHIVKDLSSIKEDCIAFPYFDGLNLPDKTTVPGIMSRYFMHLFGNSAKDAGRAFKIFCSGWNSLATTPQGVAITHLAICIEMAILTGARPMVLRTGRIYGGVVLVMPGLTIMKNGITYVAQEASKVIEALEKLDSHKSAVIGILDVINPKLFEKSEEYILYSESLTPRLLHNLLQTINLTNEEAKEVRKCAARMKFPTTFWDASSNSVICKAIRAIVNGTQLGDDEPIAYRTEAFITKDATLSILSAFGPHAPSLIGKGSSYSFGIKANNTYTPSMPGKLTLSGIPVFMKPLQEAYDDWKTLKSTKVLMMKLRVAEGKPTSVMGTTRFVSFKDGGDKINGYLGAWSEKIQAKNERKRLLEDDDENDDAKTRSKRIKAVSGVDEDFADMGFGGIPAGADSMDIDD